jgi:hypothetical protein
MCAINKDKTIVFPDYNTYPKRDFNTSIDVTNEITEQSV